MENEEVIRQQMEDTRTSLTEKLESLETKVTDTVQGASSAVTDTVANIKETVQDTVATVKDSMQDTFAAVKDSVSDGMESVKEMFDLTGHVEKHPWLMLGGSVAVGFLVEGFVGPSMRKAVRSGSAAPAAPSYLGNNFSREQTQREPEGPSMLGSFGPELNKLKKFALGALLGSVRDMLCRSVPAQMGEKLKEVIDGITEKIGGEPTPSANGAQNHSATAYNQGDSRGDRSESEMGRAMGSAHR